NHRNDSDSKIADIGKAVDEVWHPQNQAVAGGGQAKVHNREQPDSPTQESGPNLGSANLSVQGSLLIKHCAQPEPFFGLKPISLLRIVFEREENHDSQHYRRQSFQYEQPLPSGNSKLM